MPEGQDLTPLVAERLQLSRAVLSRWKAREPFATAGERKQARKIAGWQVAELGECTAGTGDDAAAIAAMVREWADWVDSATHRPIIDFHYG